VPGSYTNTIAGGYSLVGSPYPIAGGHTNVGLNTLNFAAALPNKSQVVTYDSGTASYLTATKLASGWNANFNIGVGQGFFIKNNTNITLPWIQNVGP